MRDPDPVKFPGGEVNSVGSTTGLDYELERIVAAFRTLVSTDRSGTERLKAQKNGLARGALDVFGHG